MRRFGAVALGLVALVLIVACTNLANLVLARGTTRQHELAVRAALGASRWRLVREQCTESVLLALGGAVLSIAVLQFLIRVLDVELPIAASWMVSVQPRINTTALITASAALLLALVVFGLEPALQLTRKTGVREDLNPVREVPRFPGPDGSERCCGGRRRSPPASSLLPPCPFATWLLKRNTTRAWTSIGWA